MDTEVTDRRLKEALGEVAEGFAPAEGSGTFAGIQQRAGRIRRRRHAIVGVLVLTLGAGVASLAAEQHESKPVVDAGPTPPSTVEVPVSLDATGGELPTAPLEVRGDAAVVWTGRELVVWGGDVEATNMGLTGGDRSYADGAAYDPGARTWRAMSAAPLPASFDQATGVRVDEGVVLVRGTASALWDPIEDSWRQLDAAPAPVTDLVSTGTGALTYSANARLDIATGAWTELPEPPVQLEGPTTAWTGSELVVIGGPGSPFTTAKALVYDSRQNSWRTAAAAPEELTAAALAAGWDGQRVVVVNYDMTAATYDPSADTWTELPPVPARFFEWYPSLSAQPGVSVAYMAEAVVVLTSDDTWVPLPYDSVPSGTPASTDTGAVFVWSLDSATERNVLAAFDPAAAAADPSSLQVGVASIAMPAGYALTATSIEGPGTASEGVLVEMASDGGSCAVSSTYFGIDGADLDQPVAESLQNGNTTSDWRRSTDERTWETAPTESDRLQIHCDDPRAARGLAESALFGG